MIKQERATITVTEAERAVELLLALTTKHYEYESCSNSWIIYDYEKHDVGLRCWWLLW